MKLGQRIQSKGMNRNAQFFEKILIACFLSLTQKASGDLKKGGLDPYAYVSLKQAAKKANRRNRLGVAGK